MRRIDLTDYPTEVPTEEGMKTVSYSVKTSIELALYNPELKLNYKELFENDRVAQKIQKANGSVLLEESEYEKLRTAFEGIKGLRKADIELVRRVMESPEVTVKEGE
jgi:hypothetical protein